jgi:hypothetical protein
MWKKPKRATGADRGKLWIASRRQQEDRSISPPSHSRFLELADIALGLKKPSHGKKKPVASSHDYALKTEPYKKP